MKKHSRQIAFVTGIDFSYAQRVIAGILKYVNQHPGIYFQTQGYRGFMPMPSPEQFEGNGVLGLFRDPEVIASYERRGVAVVDIGHSIHCTRRQVAIDDRRIGELAARSLLEHGYTRFLFVTSVLFGSDLHATAAADFSGSSFDHLRHQGFQEVLSQTGKECGGLVVKDIMSSAKAWEQESRRLARTIRKIPETIGIFCANDMLGHFVLETCRQHGIEVPQRAGVVGVDNDALMCHGTQPALSSVDQGEERIGYEAARLLDLILLGQEPAETIVLLDPVEVVERGSLPAMISDEPELRLALEHMRKHIASPFRISELLRATGMQRRRLERKFQQHLGTTPAGELSRLRLEKARKLLLGGDLPLKEVAGRCGYSAAASFHHAFVRAFQITPRQYRLKNRRPL